jgi:hypothetical protein
LDLLADRAGGRLDPHESAGLVDDRPDPVRTRRNTAEGAVPADPESGPVTLRPDYIATTSPKFSKKLAFPKQPSAIGCNGSRRNLQSFGQPPGDAGQLTCRMWSVVMAMRGHQPLLPNISMVQ